MNATIDSGLQLGSLESQPKQSSIESQPAIAQTPIVDDTARWERTPVLGDARASL